MDRDDHQRPFSTPLNISTTGSPESSTYWVAAHPRCFDRSQTLYDWQHYISLLERKPGGLPNGAPFETMPAAFKQLQAILMCRSGGDAVMAQVLAAVPVHGLEAVLVAAELALESSKPSGEHVLNVLAALKATRRQPT